MGEIIIITGASGVGKTSVFEKIKTLLPESDFAFFRFDSIGVPSLEVMIEQFGSPSGWQEAKTYEWMERLAKEKGNKTIIFEGQMNMDFIEGALAKNEFDIYKIVLLDCSEAEMKRRLIEDRNQPELANPDMSNWLRFLRNQASEKKIPIIDTTGMTVDQSANHFISNILAHDH
ncbi:MAG: hypothetical protein DWQ02_06445 [Bacteroidetes bacterium]|nr:MAG: hypothetical protein DWQ02_06445 [Bacteroidota bacterium]